MNVIPRLIAMGLALVAVSAWTCGAQTVPASGGGGQVEVAGTAGWVLSAPLGGASANLTPNLGLSSYTLFTTSAKTGVAAGAGVRLGYRVLRLLTVSMSAVTSRVPVDVSITGDPENPANTAFSGDTLLQWTVEGRADCAIPGLAFAHGRARPYVLAAAGSVRQRHQSGAATESGQIFEGGAGLLYTIAERPRSLVSRWSVLAEARMAHVRGGFNWGTKNRTSPAFDVGLSTTWGRR